MESWLSSNARPTVGKGRSSSESLNCKSRGQREMVCPRWFLGSRKKHGSHPHLALEVRRWVSRKRWSQREEGEVAACKVPSSLCKPKASS